MLDVRAALFCHPNICRCFPNTKKVASTNLVFLESVLLSRVYAPILGMPCKLSILVDYGLPVIGPLER